MDRLSRPSSLGMAVVALSSTGCLITATPQFKERQHTAPYLVEATAKPDPLSVLVIDSSNSGTTTFSAEVVSQDDSPDSAGQFQGVTPALLVDYGMTGPGGEPYRWVINGYKISPGTIEQSTGRRVSVDWLLDDPPIDHGCHTATLMVSHLWDEVRRCPKCNDDFSTITWQILRCDANDQDCADLVLAGCPVQSNPLAANSCQKYLDQQDAGSICPEP